MEASLVQRREKGVGLGFSALQGYPEKSRRDWREVGEMRNWAGARRGDDGVMRWCPLRCVHVLCGWTHSGLPFSGSCVGAMAPSVWFTETSGGCGGVLQGR